MGLRLGSCAPDEVQFGGVCLSIFSELLDVLLKQEFVHMRIVGQRHRGSLLLGTGVDLFLGKSRMKFADTKARKRELGIRFYFIAE